MGFCIHRHSTRHTGDIVLGGTLPPGAQMLVWQHALELNWLDTRQVHSSPVGLHTADLAHWTTSFVHQHIRSFSDRQDRVCTRRPHDVRTEPATGKEGRSSSRRRKPACAGYARTVITLLCMPAAAFCVLCFLGSLHILAHRFVLRQATLVHVGWLFSLLGCLSGPAFADLPWSVGTVPHTHLPSPILSRCKPWPAHPKLNTLPRSCVQECVLPSAAASDDRRVPAFSRFCCGP